MHCAIKTEVLGGRRPQSDAIKSSKVIDCPADETGIRGGAGGAEAARTSRSFSSGASGGSFKQGPYKYL